MRDNKNPQGVALGWQVYPLQGFICHLGKRFRSRLIEVCFIIGYFYFEIILNEHFTPKDDATEVHETGCSLRLL